MSKFKYFSFGSNLCLERIRIMNKSATFYCVGVLKGYKFTFQTFSNLWQGSTANILKTDNDKDEVYGIIWELDDADLANLDKQEKNYNRIEVNVQKMNTSEFYKCWTYVQVKGLPTQDELVKPSEKYKQLVVVGAKMNKFPDSYLKMLESFESNGCIDCGPVGLN